MAGDCTLTTVGGANRSYNDAKTMVTSVPDGDHNYNFWGAVAPRSIPSPPPSPSPSFPSSSISLPLLVRATRLLAAQRRVTSVLTCAAMAFVMARLRIGAVMFALPHALLARTGVGPCFTT